MPTAKRPRSKSRRSLRKAAASQATEKKASQSDFPSLLEFLGPDPKATIASIFRRTGDHGTAGEKAAAVRPIRSLLSDVIREFRASDLPEAIAEFVTDPDCPAACRLACLDQIIQIDRRQQSLQADSQALQRRSELLAIQRLPADWQQAVLERLSAARPESARTRRKPAKAGRKSASRS